LLKLEGLGFSQAEIVNELSQKNACSKRGVYKDFETRESWQPVLQCVVKPEAVLLKVVNRYEQIYRQASILKGNHIIISRIIELFLFAMPRALMLDEVEQWFFKFNFNTFLERWIECQKNLKKWSQKDREDFLRSMKGKPKADKKHKREVEFDGEENHN
jgi:hypothetical protein